MALPANQQLKIWGIVILVFAVTLWLLGNVMMPFILGGAVAYLLDPMADWLERHGFSRVLATVTITLFGLLIFIVLMVAVIPALVREAADLIDALPEMFQNLQAFVNDRFPDLMDETSTVRRSITRFGTMFADKGAELVEGVVTSALSLLNIFILIIIVPVVAFYLLLDWDRMVANIDDLLPREHAPTIRRLAAQIDRTLSSFIRGQGLVMLILGIFYAAALTVVGLQFGLVVGAIAGFLTFIPYVGAVVGGVMAIGLALFQFWGEWWWIAAVAGIFFLGQFVEGNILTPNLVGSSVGLHPVWLLLALSVFGALFGFVGMLVAVPVSAALGVLARFGVEQYKQGPLYRGPEPEQPETPGQD
ncbi:AI-2E family transporter [Pseudoruegeria sp. HB172150]|uniref:AI-2E family transporter n=1 Tax=Pseudoruegeria sp. HB172150 TaxID=2721164 RepID=UPI001554654F|nr:AI-2E family transporter [Pseudoruegeria sp. HB172150]